MKKFSLTKEKMEEIQIEIAAQKTNALAAEEAAAVAVEEAVAEETQLKEDIAEELKTGNK